MLIILCVICVGLFYDYFEDIFLYIRIPALHLWCIQLRFSLSISYLGFIDLQSINVCLLPDLGRFQSLFLKIFFLSQSVFPFFWVSNNTNGRSFAILPQAVGLCSFLQIFFLSVLELIVSIDLSSSLLILSSFMFILLLSSYPLNFLISGIIFWVPKFSFLFFC